MQDIFLTRAEGSAIPVYAVAEAAYEDWLAARSEPLRTHARAADFTARQGQILLAPMPDGRIDRVVLGLGKGGDPWLYARLSEELPAGDYRIAEIPSGMSGGEIALFWALGSYRFDRYKTSERHRPRLVLPSGADEPEISRIARAVKMARDLINTPANDMGPDQLQAAMETLGAEYDAEVSAIVGGELLEANFPLIHAVGRASARAPRLVELLWGDEDAPALTLVGKGVCFDTGGLNIKSAASARLMKKDMGGAANALALAMMVMDAGLNVRLRVLIPAVENSIDGDAFRPGDIIKSRKGLTVEIDNTDAEGRLILADTLARAVEEKPDLLIDFATLTGAARVAMGPQLAPYYTDVAELAAGLEKAAKSSRDPVWRMPLHKPYLEMLESPVADMVNSAASPFAGSITAALFLSRFAEGADWMHFDIYGWNASARPGRPEGGEAQGCRAAYAMLKERFGVRKA